MNVYLCDGIRTPFGKYGGALSSVRADDLAALPLRYLHEKYPTLEIDEVFMGCANQSGEDNRNVARMALLLAGIDPSVPGMTLNRLCASGLEAIAAAARMIKADEGHIALAGGVESMSRAPFVMGKSEQKFGRGQMLEDTTMGWRFKNPKMEELYGTESMPQTGENVAELYKISRQDQDAFAYRSQQRAARAIEDGILQQEIMPVHLPLGRKQKTPTVVELDEHPRETSLEVLSKLRAIVKAEGTVSAGNASGINDGAVATLIASEVAVKKYNLRPIARIVGASAAGVEPSIMGIGPINAVKKLLKHNELTTKDIGVWELNEAFASQSLAVLRALELDEKADFINANGGAIALGHPLGASGARITLHAALELQRKQARYAIACMCVGVGQGSAILLERV